MKTIRTAIAIIGIIGYSFGLPGLAFAQTSPAINNCPAGIPYTPPKTANQSALLTPAEMNWKIATSMTGGATLINKGIRTTVYQLGYCGYDEATTATNDVIILDVPSVTAFVKYGTSPNSLTKNTTPITITKAELPKTVDIIIPDLKPSTLYYVDLFIYVSGRTASLTGNNPLSFTSPAPQAVGGAENPDEAIPGAENPDGDVTKLENPIGSQIGTLPDFVKELVDILMVIGVPVVALMIIYSGFMLVTARGNEKKLEDGKKAFYAAVIGGAILLGSYVIAEAIGGTINQLRS